MLVAGKGQCEVVTNGTAPRPVVAARKGRPREERGRDKGKGDGRAAAGLEKVLMVYELSVQFVFLVNFSLFISL